MSKVDVVLFDLVIIALLVATFCLPVPQIEHRARTTLVFVISVSVLIILEKEYNYE